jgi:hypothetical protein
MKEVKLVESEKTELSVKQKKQIESELVGDIMPNKGHFLWSINNETLEIKKARFIDTDIYYGAIPKREVLINKNHTYIAALNKKNALKKFKKGETGGVKRNKELLTLF